MPVPVTSVPQELSNPVMTHVPPKFSLTIVSSSGGIVSCNEGLIVESIKAPERRDLCAGDGKVEDLGVADFEGRPEVIGKYFISRLLFKVTALAQPRHRSV